MTKKTLKKLNDTTYGLTKASIGLGVGSLIGAKIDSAAGTPIVSPAISAAAGFMPTISAVSMGGVALSGLRDLNPQRKKSRRTR